MAHTQKLYLVSMPFYSESLIRDPPGGANNVFNWSKEKKILIEKKWCDHATRAPSPLYEPRAWRLTQVYLRLESWTVHSFWYIDKIYGLHLKAKKKVRIEKNWNFFHMVLYQNASWQGNNCLMFHIC